MGGELFAGIRRQGVVIVAVFPILAGEDASVYK